MQTAKTPFLLIHGAWHGAWCWSEVVAALVEAGHPTVAIDLPGSGLKASLPAGFAPQDPEALATAQSPVKDLSATDVAAAAVSAVRGLARTFGPVHVVAHSLGGVTLSEVGETAADAVASMTYLAALAPAPGSNVFAAASAPEFADSLFLALPIADPAETGAVRINWRSADEQYRASARECFYGDVPSEVAAAASHLLTPDAPAHLYTDSVEMTEGGWGSIPRTWVRCTADRAVPIAAQDASVNALDAAFPAHRFETATLECGHCPMLSQPEALAELLSGLAKDSSN